MSQVWFITHTRNPKDLTKLIFPPKNPTSLGCRSRLALQEKESLSFLVLDETYFGLDEMILDELHAYPRWQRGLGLERDTWREPPHHPPTKM